MNNSNQLPTVVQRAIEAQKINLNNVNMMLPTKTYGEVIGQYDKVVIEVVQFSLAPRDKEVYKQGKEKALTKIALQRISSAVGIIWDPKSCGIVMSTKMKSIAQVTGAMKKANGEWISYTDTKTIDCELYEEEQKDEYTKEAEKGNPKWRNDNLAFDPWKNETEKQAWIEQKVKETVRQKRKFKDELARTGAVNRVIRFFLAIKGTYTDEELKKPFAFPRIITDTSAMMNDPRLQERAIKIMTGNVADIFGPQANEDLKNVTPQPAALPETTEQVEDPENRLSVEFDQEPLPPDEPEIPDCLISQEEPDNDVEKIRTVIAELANNGHVQQKTRVKVLDWLAREEDARSLEKLIEIQKYLEKLIENAANKQKGGKK